MVSKVLGAIAVALTAYYIIRGGDVKVSSPIIKTKYGQLEGFISNSRDGREFYEFLGIPYARPPVADLRYESPQEPAPWAGVRNAHELGSECLQIDALSKTNKGSEDCLFLNVYTPKLITGLLPVMVFIHGGIFMFGSGNMYRPEYFMDHDIVLVTLNYRLNSFGFLNTGDGVVHGNMGLKDQRLALKWVQENIQNFGGNPSQVTLFGESAGAASVHLQVLSSTTQGLFHRAISQSGVVFNTWVMKPTPEKQAKRFAERLDCSRSTTKEMVNCLKQLSASTIMDSHAETREIFKDPITMFSPTIETLIDEHTFLSEEPAELIRSGKVNKIPLMIGYNSHEGLLTAPDIVSNDTALKIFHEEFHKVMPNYIYYYEKGEKAKQVMEQIRDFYFGKGERIDSFEKFQNYTSLFTDWVWAVGAQHAIRLHSAHSPVYPYYYSYKGEFQLVKVLLAVKGNWHPIAELLLMSLKEKFNYYVFGQDPVHYGACHGDELGMMFNMPRLSEINEGHKDYEMSKNVVNLWVAFAKGDELEFMGERWHPSEPNPKSIKLLNIDQNPSIVQDPEHKRIQFLSKLYPK